MQVDERRNCRTQPTRDDKSQAGTGPPIFQWARHSMSNCSEQHRVALVLVLVFDDAGGAAAAVCALSNRPPRSIRHPGPRLG